jgi:hypothetical protein
MRFTAHLLGTIVLLSSRLLMVAGQEDEKFQAENMVLSDGVSKGAGFADYGGADNYIQWQYNVPSSRTYDVTVRYTTMGNRPLKLEVSGTKVAEFAIQSTGGWDIWKTETKSITLTSTGTKTFKLVSINKSSLILMSYWCHVFLSKELRFAF